MILVTGFEPFGGHPSNPSEEIAKAVDGRVVGGLTVRDDGDGAGMAGIEGLAFQP